MAVIDISIHKALAGLDKNQIFTIILTGIFQSTRPSRASTYSRLLLAHGKHDFNPQGPRGPRLFGIALLSFLSKFQSTRPSRASTVSRIFKKKSAKFQSTRPSRASTNVLLFIFCIALNFNPQGPRGPRPNPIETSCSQSSISIHKALAGLDVFDCYFRTVSIIISIHKALAGLDTSSVK